MRTPWAEMLRTAALLGLDPAAFWRLSLREWRLLTDRPAATQPLQRSEFDRMAETWPDD